MGKVNKQNLVSLADRTTEERRAIAVKGGIASGEARSFKRMLGDIGKEAASQGSNVSRKEYIARRLYDLAGKGNLKAIELLMRVLNELDDTVTLNVKTRDLNAEEAAKLLHELEQKI